MPRHLVSHIRTLCGFLPIAHNMQALAVPASWKNSLASRCLQGCVKALCYMFGSSKRRRSRDLQQAHVLRNTTPQLQLLSCTWLPAPAGSILSRSTFAGAAPRQPVTPVTIQGGSSTYRDNLDIGQGMLSREGDIHGEERIRVGRRADHKLHSA